VVDFGSMDRYDLIAKAAMPAPPEVLHAGMKYQNYPLAALLSVLPTTGRPVLDRTGLTGRYTFTANLTDVPGGLSGADQKRAVLQSDTPAFTALQEQLGLKLDSERAPIEMIVVDHADRVPTPN